MNIIAIGGGSLKKKQTLPIDRFIVKLTGKKSPKTLFIPTASSALPCSATIIALLPMALRAAGLTSSRLVVNRRHVH